MTVHFEFRNRWHSTWGVLTASVLLMGVCVAQEHDALQGTYIERALDTAVHITFQDTHLTDLLEFLSENHDINIIADGRIVRPKDPNQVDPAAEYVTDGVISYINLQGVTLREVLTAIVRPLSLDYSVQKSFVWISTPQHLLHESFEVLETKFYDLQSGEVQNLNADLEDVALEPIDVVNLLRHVVPEIIEPVTEKPLSFIRLNEKTNQLVVHTTPSNHRIIEKMLSLIG